MNDNRRQSVRFVLIATVVMLMAPAHAPGNGEAERYAPRAFRAAVARVMPSVVTIETYGGRLGSGEGPTTGLIISADGYILTSTFNFIRKPSIITVVLRDGSQHVAKLLGRDETRGLCLLKIDDAVSLPVPAIAPASDVGIGQWAVSVGVGYGGDAPAMSAGIISALHRVSDRAVQTDANTSPANYGGPLVDITGRVIGVCVPLSPMGNSTTAGAEWYDSGIGFAIPLDGLAAIVARLKRGDTIRPGRMGIIASPLPTGEGVKIEKVASDSPAAAAGLGEGDVITGIDGAKVIDLLALRIALGRYAAGDELTIVLTRAGATSSVTLTLAAGPFKYPQPAKPDRPNEPPAPANE